MARPLWKGTISFGLVSVPVALYTAEKSSSDLSFRLIDSRNAARVRYQRVNDETGEEVPWDAIVKGYEYNGGSYVLLSDEELENAAPDATGLIDIEQFVDVNDIGIVYFDKPYYLVPTKGGEKGYVLLREAMAQSGRVGIARIVIRSREHLAALMAEGDALILNLLRFQDELRAPSEYDFPDHDLEKHKINKKEIALAGQLIEGMTDEWKPEKFHDEYRDAIMKLIERKIESGQTEAIGVEEKREAEAAKTVNFMDALKKSVEASSKKKQQLPAKARSTTRRKASKKRAS
jgi:DNA end-binding protein Ku